MSKLLAVPTALLLASFALLSCDSSGSTASESDSKVASDVPTFVGNLATYRIDDDVLTLDWGRTIVDTNSFCRPAQFVDGQILPESLIVGAYTIERTESILIPRLGNELTVYFSVDTSPGNYVFATLFRRLGTGTGLVGEWRADEYRMREDGVWSSKGKVQLAEQIDSRLEITTDTYRWVHRQRISWAAAEVLSWTRSTWDETTAPESTYYDIEVTAIDSEAVRIRGRKTGEVLVRKRLRPSTRFLFSGDVQVSSSDSSHKTFVIKERLESCPVAPPWYDEFQQANARPAPDAMPVPGRNLQASLASRRL